MDSAKLAPEGSPEALREPSQLEIGLIYNLGAAMVKIGSLRRFVELSEQRGWNKHGACVYCARHRSLGHAVDCALMAAKEAMEPLVLPAKPGEAVAEPEPDQVSGNPGQLGPRGDVREALANFLTMYLRMANSGDCGNRDPETEPEVIAARLALSNPRDYPDHPHPASQGSL